MSPNQLAVYPIDRLPSHPVTGGDLGEHLKVSFTGPFTFGFSSVSFSLIVFCACTADKGANDRADTGYEAEEMDDTIAIESSELISFIGCF